MPVALWGDPRHKHVATCDVKCEPVCGHVALFVRGDVGGGKLRRERRHSTVLERRGWLLPRLFRSVHSSRRFSGARDEQQQHQHHNREAAAAAAAAAANTSNTTTTSTADTTHTNTVATNINENDTTNYQRQIEESGERVDVMHYHYTVSGNFQGRWAHATAMYEKIMQEEERISYITVLRSPRSHFLSYYYYYVQPEVQVSQQPCACLPRPSRPV